MEREREREREGERERGRERERESNALLSHTYTHIHSYTHRYLEGSTTRTAEDGKIEQHFVPAVEFAEFAVERLARYPLLDL